MMCRAVMWHDVMWFVAKLKKVMCLEENWLSFNGQAVFMVPSSLRLTGPKRP